MDDDWLGKKQQQNRRFAQVLYTFEATYADELSCHVGDVLEVKSNKQTN